MRASISSAWELLGVEEIQLSTETADQGPAPSCVEVPSGGRHIGSQQAVALSPSEIKIKRPYTRNMSDLRFHEGMKDRLRSVPLKEDVPFPYMGVARFVFGDRVSTKGPAETKRHRGYFFAFSRSSASFSFASPLATYGAAVFLACSAAGLFQSFASRLAKSPIADFSGPLILLF